MPGRTQAVKVIQLSNKAEPSARKVEETALAPGKEIFAHLPVRQSI